MLRLTRQQVREIDRRSIEEYHIPGIVLMENAARAAAAAAMEMAAVKSAIIACGGGNNGGDGLAIARHLHNVGWSVQLLIATEKPYIGDALINYSIVAAMKIPLRPLKNEDELFGNIARTGGTPVSQGALLVDALLGTGLESAPREPQQRLIEAMNASGLPILAVDVPSGLDCDTGRPLGISCIRATRTITFGAEKAGYANPESRQYTGQVIVGDIGCPRELIQDVAESSG